MNHTKPELVDLISCLRVGERKIMEATIADRFERLAKANRRIMVARRSDPNIDDRDFSRKESIIRVDLEIPKSIATDPEGISPSDVRGLISNLNSWLRGAMTRDQVEDWWFILDEHHELDCGWLFFDSPCNFHGKDPSKPRIESESILEYMIEIGTRNES